MSLRDARALLRDILAVAAKRCSRRAMAAVAASALTAALRELRVPRGHHEQVLRGEQERVPRGRPGHGKNLKAPKVSVKVTPPVLEMPEREMPGDLGGPSADAQRRRLRNRKRSERRKNKKNMLLVQRQPPESKSTCHSAAVHEAKRHKAMQEKFDAEYGKILVVQHGEHNKGPVVDVDAPMPEQPEQKSLEVAQCQPAVGGGGLPRPAI